MTSVDWGEAPEVRRFYGRSAEIKGLAKEVLTPRRRLVMLQGMKGVGKTRLALATVRRRSANKLLANVRDLMTARFDFVIWRSLFNAPPLDELLGQINTAIQLGEAAVDKAARSPVDVFFEKTKAARCLIILDNLESLLESGESSAFRKEAADYNTFLARFSAAQHGSCILVTTREVPATLAAICGPAEPSVVVKATGLADDACGRILDDHQIDYTPELLKRLVSTFGGNPLALQLAAKRIIEVFKGDVSKFIDGDGIAFHEVQDLLVWHFDRLAARELRLAYCLAVAREPSSIDDLVRILGDLDARQVGDLLADLVERILIDIRESTYTFHPVLMEYLTDRLVAAAEQAIQAGTFGAFDLPLLYATAKDFVRRAEERLLVRPVLRRLEQTVAGAGLRPLLESLLSDAHRAGASRFCAGNVLNLMCAADIEMRDLDCTGLVVRHAYLQDVRLVDCDFSDALFDGCVFATTLGAVLAVAIAPGDREVVTGDNHGDVRAWRISDGAELRRYEGHRSWVRTLAFSPTVPQFASGGSDNEVRIWETASSACLQVLRERSEQVYAVDFSSDGSILASGAEDGEVHLWRLAEEKLEARIAVPGRVRSVRFGPRDDRLIIACEDLLLHFLERDEQRRIKQAADYVRRAVFHPDGSKIAYVDSGGCIHVVDGTTLELRRTLASPHKANWVEFSPDGTTLAAGCADGHILRWSTAEAFDQLPEIIGHPASVRAIAFSPSSKLLASAGEDRAVRIWDHHDRLLLRTVQGYANGIRGVAWRPGTREVAGACEDGTVRFWDAAGTSAMPVSTLPGHTKTVEAIAFDGTRGRSASASDDGTVRLHDWSANSTTTLQGHRNWVWCVAFSQDGNRLASGGRDKRVMIWDAASGALLQTLEGHTDEVHCVAFTNNDTCLISGSDDKTMRIWDTATWQVTKIVDAHADCVRSLAYNPKQSIIASSGDDGLINLWTHDGDLIQTLHGHVGRVRSVVFAADGRLYSAGDDRVVRAWDRESACCTREFQGHAASVWSLALDDEDRWLASGSEDESLRIWDLQPTGTDRLCRPERRYQNMNIAGARGLELSQVRGLTGLGAITTLADGPGKGAETAGGASREILEKRMGEPEKNISPDPVAKAFSSGHALVIAAAEYDLARPKLPQAVRNDADDIAKMLVSAQCGYPSSQVEVLVDASATLAGIRDGLSRLAANCGPDDTAFIFFSGHGGLKVNVSGTEVGLLLPIDCDPSDLISTSLSDTAFSEALAKIKAKRVLVALDACHSGGTGTLKAQSNLDLKGGLSEKGLQRLADGTGRVIMSSSRADELSVILPGARNSLFTEAFLDALRGKASGSDGLIRVFDVFAYISEAVVKAEPDQHPVFQAKYVEMNFAIAVNGGIAKGNAGAPSVDSRELETIMPELYPTGPEDEEIWVRAGGDLSRLRLHGSGRSKWTSALRQLAKGGGGETVTAERLIDVALEDYPRHIELKKLAAERYRRAAAAAHVAHD